MQCRQRAAATHEAHKREESTTEMAEGTRHKAEQQRAVDQSSKRVPATRTKAHCERGRRA